MPVPTEPSPRVHASFLAALREYHAEGAYTRAAVAQAYAEPG